LHRGVHKARAGTTLKLMGSANFMYRLVACGALAAAPWLVHAQGFTADYDIARSSPVEAVGLSLQAGRNWFGQLGFAQAHASTLSPAGTSDSVNVSGGYRWGDGQSLSLQLSRGRGPGQRLGLAVNYDWPHYFVRFSYDQGFNLVPQDSLRFSAGVRF